jgi:glycosidase
MQDIFSLRSQDWRVGKIVYQIFVDRFAPALNLESKRHRYQPGQHLLPWDALPKPGTKLTSLPYYAHELDFWGGDLQSLISKLDHLTRMGVQTVYLNPIFQALSNHKYDTIDYLTISSEYGSNDDFLALIKALKERNIRLVLDGVFNHVSSFHPFFLSAKAGENSSYRDWFVFGPQFRHGYRAWHHAPSLPELNLDNPNVRDYLFKQVVQHYLHLGVDGWRLDTAIELGSQHLNALTQAAHDIKPDTLVIGEILQYPSDWIPSVDAVIHLGLRDWLLHTITGRITPAVANRQLQQYVNDLGMEATLRSWIALENHDLPRIRHVLHDDQDYHFAKILQFALPGNVQLYQGEELGLTGSRDPSNREPYPWHIDAPSNPIYQFHQQLIALRLHHRALTIGDFLPLISDQFIAFARTTNQLEETCLVLANPTAEVKTEWILLPFAKLPYDTKYVDLLTKQLVTRQEGMYLSLTLKPKQIMILSPVIQPVEGYLSSKYER